MRGTMRGAILILALALPTPAAKAQPLFVNPDFETGDFTGWTLTYVGGGTDGVLTGLPAAATGGGTGEEDAVVVPAGWGTDPYTNHAVAKVFSGNYSARIGDANNQIKHDGRGNDDPFSVTLSQTAALTEPLVSMSVTWAAAVTEPSNFEQHEHCHGEGGCFPGFSLLVTNETTGEVLLDIMQTAQELGAFWDLGVPQGSTSDHNNKYRPTRHDTEGTWWYQDWTTEVIDLAGAEVGDEITIMLTAQDCGLRGHPAYARLDEIGYEVPPDGTPPGFIPEPATILLLLGGLAVAGWRGRRSVGWKVERA